MESMTKEHRKALVKTLVTFGDLGIEEALVYLQSQEILTESDVEAIDQHSVRSKQVTELVKRIKQKGDKSYFTFKKFLEETPGSEHIAKELDKNLKEVKETLANVTQQREKGRETEEWKKIEDKFHNPSFSCDHDSIHQYLGISKDINVLLIGKSGAGKSATGNTLIGKDIFVESETDAPETKSVKFDTIQEGTFNITVVDTPGIQNEELLLNVVEKMIDFEGGIHLFLVVCKGIADQEITKVMSRVLAETACDQCVVILTNTTRFGGKKTIQYYIERQKNHEEPTANLFQLVKNRIIAVENCFEEEDVMMKDLQRQKLLCCLAQVIKDNKGLVYSKISFQNAKTRIEQSRLQEYLPREYLKDISQQQLDNIPSTLDDKMKDTMQACQALELYPPITEGDAKRMFIQEKEKEICKIQADERWKALADKFYCFSCKHENIGNYTDVPEKINILLIGKTGSGKSATGNTIIGKTYFKVSGTSASVTKTIDMIDLKESRFNITVIDTPGLFDTTKEFENKELLLETAKTMINFKEGIHLFLLVVSSTSKFTAEEQETINDIENVLGKSVYKNCLLVLTYAGAKFGSEDQDPLRQYVTQETEGGGKFADLLYKFNNRVIAVENRLGNDFLTEKHRQKLLCCLAQIIHDNKGSLYSNKAFEKAKARVEQQEAERKRRVAREKELTFMKTRLHEFLLQKYLEHLTKKELENILSKVRKETQLIMTRSGVRQLPLITSEDVKTYVECFIQKNEVLIEKLKNVRNQEAIQQLEYEKWRQWLEEKEEINQIKRIVLPLVSNFLQKQSKQELENIVRNKRLPGDIKPQITAALKSSKVNFESQHTKSFIQAMFCANPKQIKEYTDGKVLKEILEETSKQLLQVQREHKLNEIMGTLKTNLSDRLEGKTEEELEDLKTDLTDSGPGNWKPLFTELVGSQIEGSDISMIEVTNLFLKQNNYWLQSILESLLVKQQQQREEKLLQESEELKNSAFTIISTEIKINLKSYLISKNASELATLKAQLARGKIPTDIFNKVKGKLTSAQQQSLSEDEIETEILKQIQKHYEIIEKCMKDAEECFAGSTEVRIKKRGIAKIYNVTVDDEILVFDVNGNLFYDKVYLISHAREDENITYVRLQTSSGKDLRISPGHLLPVGSLGRNVTAKDVSLGNIIFTLQDDVMKPDRVTSVTYELCRGAYCPMTMDGTIVVNDVAASCYTTFFPSPLAHALLSPIRLLFSYLPLPLFNRLLPYDTEEGMPVLLLKCRSIVFRWRSLFTRNDNPIKSV